MRRGHQLDGGMQHDPGPLPHALPDGEEVLRHERRRVGGVRGAGPGRLEARHVGEVGHRRGGGEVFQEVAEPVPPGEEHRGDRRRQLDEDPGGGGEEFRPDQRPAYGMARRQHPDEAGKEVVAVDGEAGPGRGGEGVGRRPRRVEQRARERLRKVGVHQAGSRIGRADRMRSARRASSKRVASGGTSSSHSISVGSGPVRATTVS